MRETIVVAGGGVTGLTTAYYLQKQARAVGANPEIILVERDNRLGGKTQTEVVDGFVIEHGPDSFVVHKPWFKRLVQELDLPLVGTNPDIKTTYIYKRGCMQQLPVGMQIMIPTQIWPFLKTRLISPWGKLRAGLEPFIPIKRSDADESIGSFVTRRFGKEIMVNLAGPLMGGIHGGDYDTVSMKASFPQFMKMEREQGSLLLAAQRSKAHRPKGPTGSFFQTVPTGLKHAMDALADACTDVEFRTGTSLTGLKPVENRYTVQLSDGTELEADAVVLAVPAYVAGGLVQEFLPEVAAELNDIPYGSSVVAALAYNRADVDHPLDASGFLIPHTEQTEISASTWVSSKWPHTAPPDKVLLRCFFGRSTGKDWTEHSDEELVAAARRGLEQTMGLKAEPILTRISRWPRAMVTYRVGHLERMDEVEQMLQASPGLYLAGAAYRGVGLPDCTREGLQAAEKAARHLGWISEA